MKTATDLLNANLYYRKRRFAGATYYAFETRQWYAVTAERLADLQDLLTRGVPDAYSLWCADGVERGFATEAEAAASAGWGNP